MKKVEVENKKINYYYIYSTNHDDLTINMLWHLSFLIRLGHTNSEIIVNILPIVSLLLHYLESGSYTILQEHFVDLLYLYSDFNLRYSRSHGLLKTQWLDVLKLLRSVQGHPETRGFIKQHMASFAAVKCSELTQFGFESIEQLEDNAQLEILYRWIELEIFQWKQQEHRRSRDDLEQYTSRSISPLLLQLPEIDAAQLSSYERRTLAWLLLKRPELRHFPKDIFNLLTFPIAETAKIKLPRLFDFVLKIQNLEGSLSSFRRKYTERAKKSRSPVVADSVEAFVGSFGVALTGLVTEITVADFESREKQLSILVDSLRSLGQELDSIERDFSKSLTVWSSLRSEYSQSTAMSDLLSRKWSLYLEHIQKCLDVVVEEYSKSKYQQRWSELKTTFHLDSFPIYFEGINKLQYLRSSIYRHSVDPACSSASIYSRVLDMHVRVLDEFPAKPTLSCQNLFQELPYYDLLRPVLRDILIDNDELSLCMANQFLELIEHLSLSDYDGFPYHKELKGYLAEIIAIFKTQTNRDESTFLVTMDNLKGLLSIKSNLTFKLSALRMLFIASGQWRDNNLAIQEALDCSVSHRFTAYFHLLRAILPRSSVRNKIERAMLGDLDGIEASVEGSVDVSLAQEISELSHLFLEKEFNDALTVWKSGTIIVKNQRNGDWCGCLLHAYLAVMRNQGILFKEWAAVLSLFQGHYRSPNCSARIAERVNRLIDIEGFAVLLQRPRAEVELIVKNIREVHRGRKIKGSGSEGNRLTGINFFEKALSLSGIPAEEEQVNRLLDLASLFFKRIEADQPAADHLKEEIDRILQSNPSLLSLLNAPPVMDK